MDGINATSGKLLGGIDHLLQSIRDIIGTPTGTRVMLREYGSLVPALIDAPMNRDTILKIYVAVVDALAKWEPRLTLYSVKISDASPGKLSLTLSGLYKPDGRVVTLKGIEVTR